MVTLQGTISNCQHTLQVSGGGSSNNSTSTTYISLFRVDNRAVEFRTNRPSSVSDGDQVVVAGVTTRTNALRAYACRNVTTGEVTNSGLWGNLVALLFFPLVLGFVTFLASAMLGKYALYGGTILLVLVMGYFIRQFVLTRQAITQVQS